MDTIEDAKKGTQQLAQDLINQGKLYEYDNQQYNRFVLEDQIIDAINGKRSQKRHKQESFHGRNPLISRPDDRRAFVD